MIAKGDIYESKNYHNVVFVGRDKVQNPRYAAMRGTDENRYRGEARGSEKAYGFGHIGTDEKLFVFESPIVRHDSVMINKNEWYRFSQNKGGHAIDFMKEFYGLSFAEAVKELLGEEGVGETNRRTAKEDAGRQKVCPIPLPGLEWPERNDSCEIARKYLIEQRKLSEQLIDQMEWYRFSQNKGGHAIDFMKEFYGLSFAEAVKELLGEEGVGETNRRTAKEDAGRQKVCPIPLPGLEWPERNDSCEIARKYLIEQRKLSEQLIDQMIAKGDIYESKNYHNVVFVGRD